MNDRVLVPAVDLARLPEAQRQVCADFLNRHSAPGFHRPEDGAFVHGCSISLIAYADASLTDLIVMAGNETPMQVRITPSGDVTETETSVRERAAVSLRELCPICGSTEPNEWRHPLCADGFARRPTTLR